MDARRVTGYSNRVMGREMAEAIDRANFYAPSTIARMCHPRAKWAMPMKREHLEAAAWVLDEWVKRAANRGDVRFEMTVNSPWECTLLIQCKCGHWERLDLRRDTTQCAECRSAARE